LVLDDLGSKNLIADGPNLVRGWIRDQFEEATKVVEQFVGVHNVPLVVAAA
jgi:hypothetical protein